jgi:hypothetical protein
MDVQIYDSLGNRRACTCSDLVSVVKMATVLEECTIEKQRSIVQFFVG